MLCVLCLYVGHVMSGCDQTLMYLLMNEDFLHTNYCMGNWACCWKCCSNIYFDRIVIRTYGRMARCLNTQTCMLGTGKKGAPLQASFVSSQPGRDPRPIPVCSAGPEPPWFNPGRIWQRVRLTPVGVSPRPTSLQHRPFHRVLKNRGRTRG
jgi:hypothetical protein